MKTIKKNQIIVFVIGLMLITAGYLNFTNTYDQNSIEAGALLDSEEMASIGDAKLVSANVIDNNIVGNNEIIEEVVENENVNQIENEISENTIENEVIDTSSQNIDEYFTTSKLERNTMYSQKIETYQDILSNNNVSDAQKKIAQEEIAKANKEQNAIMIAENLIKTKGIDDLIIFVNGESINVIVKGDDLEKDEIAQIQNIVTRELEADIANVHIMNKK